MADLGMDLDHEQVESGRNFDPIPPGTYLAQINASDVVTTKAGTGKIAKFAFEVLEGPFERRIVFDQVNYQNPNPTAQLIGQQRIKAICEAVGHTGPLRDTAHVEFKPLRIRVGIDDKDPNYAPKNVIKDVKAAGGAQPSGRPANPPMPRAATNAGTAAVPAQAAPPQRTPGGSGGAAWRR